MQKEFKIVFVDGQVVITDGDGAAVNQRTAHLVIKALRRAYPIPAYVYMGRDPMTDLRKIGMSVNVDRRAEQLGIELEHTIACPSQEKALHLEQFFHWAFGDQRKHGEWFDLDSKNQRAFCTYDQEADMRWLIDTMFDFLRGARDTETLYEWARQNYRPGFTTLVSHILEAFAQIVHEDYPER